MDKVYLIFSVDEWVERNEIVAAYNTREKAVAHIEEFYDDYRYDENRSHWEHPDGEGYMWIKEMNVR